MIFHFNRQLQPNLTGNLIHNTLYIVQMQIFGLVDNYNQN